MLQEHQSLSFYQSAQVAKMLCCNVNGVAIRGAPLLRSLLASTRTMNSSSTTDTILINENNNSATIVINRPKILNALNMQLIREINAKLKEFQKSKSFVIIKASSSKSFSAGGDINALIKGGLEESRVFFREVYTLLHFISNNPVPNIALIDGLTMGGGVALAIHGKYCVATERTQLAMPETAIGLFPDVGSSYFLNRLNGKLGLYLGMTGNRLVGEDVARFGLASHFCESNQLPHLECELVKATNANEIPKILRGFSSAIGKEGGVSLLLDKINNCFSAPSVEKIFENLEKDGSEWAIKTLQTLKEKSPTSLKLTYRQIQLGATNMPLDQCLKMEYRMAFRCLANSDFREGVRALIIEKDRNPAWNPPTLEDVTEDYVAQFFERLPESEELKL